jgi:hypothetical protein
MKTSSLEHKDPDVFWLRVRLLVEVEFVVFSLSFELMFMSYSEASQGKWVYIPCLFSISPEAISNTRMLSYFVYCILIIVDLLQGVSWNSRL